MQIIAMGDYAIFSALAFVFILFVIYINRLCRKSVSTKCNVPKKNDYGMLMELIGLIMEVISNGF